MVANPCFAQCWFGKRDISPSFSSIARRRADGISSQMCHHFSLVLASFSPAVTPPAGPQPVLRTVVWCRTQLCHARPEGSEQGRLPSALWPGASRREILSGCWRAQQLSGEKPFALSPQNLCLHHRLQNGQPRQAGNCWRMRFGFAA